MQGSCCANNYIYLGCCAVVFAPRVCTHQHTTNTLRHLPRVQPKVLNATPQLARQEARIIAQAGMPGAVTVATNMAGRGTDILLGGAPKWCTLMTLENLLLPVLLDAGMRAWHDDLCMHAVVHTCTYMRHVVPQPRTSRVSTTPLYLTFPPASRASWEPNSLGTGPLSSMQRLRTATPEQLLASLSVGPRPRPPKAPLTWSTQLLEELCRAADTAAQLGRQVAETRARGEASPATMDGRLALEVAVARNDVGMDTAHAQQLVAEVVELAEGRFAAMRRSFDAMHSAESTVEQDPAAPPWGVSTMLTLVARHGQLSEGLERSWEALLRRQLLRVALLLWCWYDYVCRLWRAQVVEAGGLLVVGTSLQENARVEQQLRGRAGRQVCWVTVDAVDALWRAMSLTYNTLCLLPPAYKTHLVNIVFPLSSPIRLFRGSQEAAAWWSTSRTRACSRSPRCCWAWRKGLPRTTQSCSCQTCGRCWQARQPQRARWQSGSNARR